ncbi:hypothetical protein ACLOJK_029675, partial [Asimina triloba]
MGKESREDEDDRLLMRCECDVGRETWHQQPDKGYEVMYPTPMDSSQAPRAPRDRMHLSAVTEPGSPGDARR